MTGRSLGDRFVDEAAEDPWGEINAIVPAVTAALDLPATSPLDTNLELSPTPRSDAEDSKTPGILNCAVIGLFPAANQGLLNDLEALRGGEAALGPIESFLKADAELGVRRNQSGDRDNDVARRK